MIVSIETFIRGAFGLVRISSDDGQHGWGQMARMDADCCAILLHRHLAPLLLGADEERSPELTAHLELHCYKYRGSHLMRAMAGIDTAIWDLRARRRNIPVCQLAGGAPRSLPVYGSSMRRDTSPEAEISSMRQAMQAYGLKAFKCKIGPRLGRHDPQASSRTDALIPGLRQALGPEVVLMADANGSYDAAAAIAVGRQLEHDNYFCFEEPCPYWQLEETTAVNQTLSIPVAGGEQDFDLHQFQRMIAMQAVSIAQPDVGYLGGFSRALAVAKMAQAAGLSCMPHSPNSSLLSIFTLHLLSCIDNATGWIERDTRKLDGSNDLYHHHPTIVDGMLATPDGPGWGVEIQPSWLRQAEHWTSSQ